MLLRRGLWAQNQVVAGRRRFAGLRRHGEKAIPTRGSRRGSLSVRRIAIRADTFCGLKPSLVYARQGSRLAQARIRLASSSPTNVSVSGSIVTLRPSIQAMAPA
jgi:hypothetical protein